MIDGDPDRLHNVVSELLSNALTWAHEDSTIGLTLHADGHTAVLAVTNTGTRIPADERNRVFDLLFRGERAQHSGLPGIGLGLTYARAIIEQHGGTITISEHDEAVTTFIVRLPSHPEVPGAATPESADRTVQEGSDAMRGAGVGV